MFIDTSVMIWAFRGNAKAMQFLDETDELYISAVVYIELIQGAKNKQELRAINASLNMLQIKIIQINESISILATELVKTYFHSHGIQLADALIGATASLYKMDLITSNVKHFLPIKELNVISFIPN